jgi:acetylglutamate kinase
VNSDPLVSREDSLRVSVLSEALPYIQRFAGRRVVVKYGGAAMVREDLREAVFRDLALLACVGVQPVVVHGGGPEINQWLTRLAIEPRFHNGLRITDAATMDVVEMVLVGRVNKQIVTGLNRVGGKAVGLSGCDGRLVQARPWGDGSNGLVGDVARVKPDVLKPLLDGGYIPVISSVAPNAEGQAHNINADTVAGPGLPDPSAHPRPGQGTHRHRGGGGGHDPEDRVLHPCPRPGGERGAHHRWSGGPLPAAGGVLQCGHRHDGGGQPQPPAGLIPMPSSPREAHG